MIKQQLIQEQNDQSGNVEFPTQAQENTSSNPKLNNYYEDILQSSEAESKTTGGGAGFGKLNVPSSYNTESIATTNDLPR